MSELDLLKILQNHGEETDLADFSLDELEDLLEELRGADDSKPLTVEELKKRYFEYYDDVKDPTLKKQDW